MNFHCLSQIELYLRLSATSACLSWMDFQGKSKCTRTTSLLIPFRTPFGIYSYLIYIIMPFGLKNAGARTLQAMTQIFREMLHKTVECYVDDLAVKSRKEVDHLADLRQVFSSLGNLKMNPLKCFFGVSSGGDLIIYRRLRFLFQNKLVFIPTSRN